jgi:hypothetical protein
MSDTLEPSTAQNLLDQALAVKRLAMSNVTVRSPQLQQEISSALAMATGSRNAEAMKAAAELIETLGQAEEELAEVLAAQARAEMLRLKPPRGRH